MIWQDGPVTVHIGDALSVLRELPAESVHCVVTSPPYWGLRDYGIPSQLGLEATPEEYIARMVEVFREVRRVLRKDGTLWLNMGDSYANGGMSNPSEKSTLEGGKDRGAAMYSLSRSLPPGLKSKDLVGIPWRLAFALQADGWWLRSDIIWSKPNPMPESVTDRPTKAHEYVFLLTKSARYFYDAEAVREPNTSAEQMEHNIRYARPYTAFDDRASATGVPGAQNNVGIHSRGGIAGRNLRSVWTIATQPYPEAHFATFPEELARRCIAAGTSERGCCPECGAPWERVVERIDPRPKSYYALPPNPKNAAAIEAGFHGKDSGLDRAGWQQYGRPFNNLKGWQPTCAHVLDPVPCTVLDPFAGSGTTLAVARRMGRRSVGIELQADYLPLIQRRVSEAALPLLEAIG